MNFKYIKKDHVMRSYDEQVRFLDINGNLIDKNVDTELTKDQLLDAYKWMVLSRQQDTYMTQLQKQGRMLSFAPNFGEEALQVASAFALKKEDWFAPAYRSNATMLALGVPIKNQLLYWNGQERGSVTPVGVNVLPINIPIATQYSHAAGIAYAAKLQGKKTVAMSIVGNGGTGEGEFYEAMNISSIWKWPAVFTVNNNQWAISTPFKYGSGSKTIAQKAEAVGIPGVIVDGNDLLASYAVIKEAVEWARGGNGPVLVEFLTWRKGVHTSSDNPRIYRTEEEEKEHEKWEPFHRIEKYLKDKKYITDEEIKQIWDSSLDKVKTTYEESLKELDTQLDEIFDHTYATLTQELKEQKQHAKDYYAKEGK